MAVFENLPYTNFHELNADWVVSTVKDLAGQWEEYKDFFEDVKNSVSVEIAEQIDEILKGVYFYPSALPALIGEKVTWDGWHGQGFCLMNNYAAVYMQDGSNPPNGKLVRFSLIDGSVIDSHSMSTGKGNDLTYDPDRNRLYVVDGNDNEIGEYNASTFALIATHTIGSYLLHGISYYKDKIYAYHYGSGVVEMLEIDPVSWSYKTIFVTSITAHVYQGLAFNGVFFYALTKDPGAVVRFDLKGHYSIGNPLIYTADDYYLGELEGIDFQGDKMIMYSQYTDYVSDSFLGRRVTQMQGWTDIRKPRVNVFSEYSPGSNGSLGVAQDHPSVENDFKNLYVNFGSAPFKPTGYNTAQAFSCFAELQAYNWHCRTMNVHIDDMPAWSDAPTKYYVPVVTRDNMMLTVRDDAHVLAYGCSNVHFLHDDDATPTVDIGASYAQIWYDDPYYTTNVVGDESTATAIVIP